ncbi:MAG: CRTAC1 family protein [Halofilum sp. (in: g-proteobacteria)]|nr:CRTAC1 family protein [Halofilum sp. (in: g-proteobacteria)]
MTDITGPFCPRIDPARRRLRALAALPLLAAAIVTACQEPSGEAQSESGSTTEHSPGTGATTTPSAPPFIDATERTGPDFRHFNGMAGAFYIAEIMGSGAALFDYDNDGDLDAYLAQGRMLDGSRPESARIPVPAKPLPFNGRLYENRLIPDGELAFEDVTERSRIRTQGYGMGVAAGDFDGDGFVDLYLTNFGAPNQLMRNAGDGTFDDVTRMARVGDTRWSVSASFVDHDDDGDLDLYVGNYIDFTVATDKDCYVVTSALDYCGPQAYAPVADRLYRNEGDGSFTDATEQSGIAAAKGSALGVLAADLDGSGSADIYVANDGNENLMWMNDGHGRFTDRALAGGTAVNMDGVAEAGMGVDAGDYDGDGDLDLFMTHLDRETNTLYVNDGKGAFQDETVPTALASPSLPFTGFGTAWVDYDLDGWLDVLSVNGAVRILPELQRKDDPLPLHQRNQLFRNDGTGGFTEVSSEAGPAFEASRVSRGAAFGDVDNDGDTDVLISNNGGSARMLLNTADPQPDAWIGFRVRANARDAVGSRVGVVPANGRIRWRRVHTDGSYASASDPRVTVSLAGIEEIREVRVRWPDGSVEAWPDPPVGRYNSLQRGGGQR